MLAGQGNRRPYTMDRVNTLNTAGSKRGTVVFLAVTQIAPNQPSARVIEALNGADLVIWTSGATRRDLLAHLPAHAEIIDDGIWTTPSLLPFYDWASRGGFRIAQVTSARPVHWQPIFDQVDRCRELGLLAEIVGCT